MIVLYFILGGLFILYDIALLISSPRTFLDNLTSFTHIWIVFGIILFFAIYRLKKDIPFDKAVKMA